MLNILKEKITDLANFPFVFLLMALSLFFWINGPSFFDSWDSSNSNVITAYLVMMVVFITWSKKETRSHLKIPLKDSILGFTLGMFITFMCMNLLFYTGVMSVPIFPPDLFWPTVILQITTVALVEEIVFRGVFLEYTGILISSILFAAWHSYAYNFIWYEGSWDTFNWGAMIFVFAIGVILALIVEASKNIEKEHKIKLGLPCTIAIHATYNLCILGAFYWG